jgi:nanoRNase/pAp phosphatase (c-di-AMP/oligoRNAs hydrolase)
LHQLLADDEVPYPVLATLASRFRTVSISLRSENGEALPVARQLQGGGHPNASGATLPNTVQRMPDAIVYLKKVLNTEVNEGGLGSLEEALKGLEVK